MYQQYPQNNRILCWAVWQTEDPRRSVKVLEAMVARKTMIPTAWSRNWYIILKDWPDEEQVRLKNHCEYFKSILKSSKKAKAKNYPSFYMVRSVEINTTGPVSPTIHLSRNRWCWERWAGKLRNKCWTFFMNGERSVEAACIDHSKFTTYYLHKYVSWKESAALYCFTGIAGWIPVSFSACTPPVNTLKRTSLFPPMHGAVLQATDHL